MNDVSSGVAAAKSAAPAESVEAPVPSAEELLTGFDDDVIESDIVVEEMVRR